MSRPFRRLSPERQSARVRLGASLGHMWRISADCDEWAQRQRRYERSLIYDSLVGVF